MFVQSTIWGFHGTEAKSVYNGSHLCRRFHIGSHRIDTTSNMQFGDCYDAAFKMSLTVKEKPIRLFDRVMYKQFMITDLSYA